MSAAKTPAQAVHRLEHNQMAAVAPDRSVWLSASAGTGKTQVLTSRVLRLLLQPGVEPDQILCLTFTKAGAAEMATRIGEKLADWVRLEDTLLATQLQAIGARYDPATLARARSRFAAVLDCPGGGLRIGTIHAFAQWLLSAFPEEAGLRPGSRAMEDRDRDLLVRAVLVDLLVRAQDSGDSAFIDALAALSLRMAEGELTRFLLRCAAATELWTGPGAWQAPLRPRINQLVGLPADADAALLADCYSDARFPVSALGRCMDALRAWGTKTGTDMVAAIGGWLAGTPDARAASAQVLTATLFTKEGEAKHRKNVEKRDPAYTDHAGEISEALHEATELARALALVDFAEPALAIGRRFAVAWDAAKTREGFIDFDDQIRAAATLLTERAPADWIRFKLDRRFDHVLVDEAQDTNPRQWDIVLDGVTGDFRAGAGKPNDGPSPRTLFVVGDYKQAIFGFQGTSPKAFEAARRRVSRELAELADAANDPALDLLDLGLGRSFRSAQPILTLVDNAIAAIGPERFGLPDAPEPHLGHAIPGLVCLWQPLGVAAQADDDDLPAEGGEDTWLSAPERELAARIARQVRHWIDHGYALTKGRHRRATAGDVMVLVRKRGALAALIVARLHAEGVPVAGVDRLRLGAPLAVKDLIAALQFCVQPGDDLNLANLLVSPLIGWSQADLLAHGYRTPGVRLWDHLRQTESAATHRTMDMLRDVLSRADFVSPAALLNWILVGPWQGRKALLARLGAEAGDPIDELINAAMAHSASQVPGLAGFLHWFAAGDGDVKRDAGGHGGLVRVMTVHGSKGLQAPIVILADATADPGRSQPAPVDLDDSNGTGNGRSVPLPPLRKDEKPPRVRAAETADKLADREEHWRLMYVAMTRAEEALFVTGALGPLAKGVVPEDSWYAALSQIMPDIAERSDAIWTRSWHFGAMAALPPSDPLTADRPTIALPEDLRNPIGPEPRPLRPLAPSALGDEAAPAPPTPPGPGARAAARRGIVLHRLLERLPEVAPADRSDIAAQWLARMANDLPPEDRDALARSALAVLAEPSWSAVFGPGSLAEVPIAALVGTRMVNGTIDRLLITPDTVQIVDFKTDRRPPDHADAIPAAYLRQMAAYVAALRVICPGRHVSAALLYTAIPRLYALDDAVIAAQKLGLEATQETF